jgi:glycosyltransferase involved in cell wall biosynthesis
MRILKLKAYYHPESYSSSYLTNNLIEDLIETGHEVELYVPLPTRGISNEERNLYKKRKYEECYNGRLKIHRFYMFREGKNPVLRAIRYTLLSFAYIFKSIKVKDFNVISVGSTPPTMGIVATIIKKIKGQPFVYSLQDIFPDSLVNTGLVSKDSFLWKVGRIIENYTYKNADKIIVISEDFKQNIITKGVPEEKVEVIYNWVDENTVIPINRDDNILFEKYKLDREKFYVVYAGNLGHAQNIDVILKAAEMLSDYEDIRFIIFGGGQHESYYKHLSKLMNLSNISFFPLQPYSLVSSVYSLGDVSIVSCKQGLGKSAMPSKTWSIMSAETAVIASFDEDTDLQRIIEKNNVGLFTKAGNAEELRSAILYLYNNRTLCIKMGKNGREFIINILRRKIGTEKYINVLESVSR